MIASPATRPAQGPGRSISLPRMTMSKPEASKLVAATYNIHYAIGTDRRFAPSRIAEVILSLAADVVALQEVGWHYRGRAGVDQFDILHEMTGFEVHAGLTRSHARANFGNAVLARAPARHVETLDLSVRFRAPRGALIVELDTAPVPLRVVNVHLGLDPWERTIQVKRLVKALAEAAPRPTLLLGDFNEWRRRPAYLAPLTRHFPTCAMPPSFHARRAALSFDRIYLSEPLALEHARAVHSPSARRASDHLPVVATIGWG